MICRTAPNATLCVSPGFRWHLGYFKKPWKTGLIVPQDRMFYSFYILHSEFYIFSQGWHDQMQTADFQCSEIMAVFNALWFQILGFLVVPVRKMRKSLSFWPRIQK